MGSHWRWLDYASIDALVSEARSGAEGQIRLMMRFVEKANLLDKLRNHDWAGFARAYNGPAYRKNRYDTKMRGAWLKHRSNANLPGILKPEFGRHEMVYLKFGSHGDAVYQLQKTSKAWDTTFWRMEILALQQSEQYLVSSEITTS